MRGIRKYILILCSVLLLLSNMSSPVYAVTRWYSAEEDIARFLKDEKSIKKEIDKSNSLIEELYTQIKSTNNGVKVLTAEDINTIDTETHNILMLEEVLRRSKEGTMSDFIYVTYPLVSEIEHYGIRSGYTDSLYTDEYLNKKENDEYTDIRVDFNFFKEVPYEKFVQAVELIDFIDISNLQVLFNPYKLFSSFAYCECYSPETLNNRRTRVYFIATEGEDIVSTFYHELGHMIYDELVEGNDYWYNKYYNLYKTEFDTYNAADNYGRWDEKLTENFAEDFKIYVTHKILNTNREEAEYLSSLVYKHEKSFLGKSTKYTVNNQAITEYFNSLLKEYETNNLTVTPLRPDIELKLEDYATSFKYKDSTYTNEYINKICTNSSKLSIDFKNLETSELKLKNIKVSQYSNGSDFDYDKLVNYKYYNLGEDNIVDIPLKKKEVMYEVEINLEVPNGLYSEVVRYFIFK